MFTFKKIGLISVAAIAAISISCSDDKGDDDGKDQALTRKSFNLSFANESYGDIDAVKTYKQDGLTDAVKGAIDVVAYYSDVSGDEVINPCLVTTIGADDCGDPEFYPIPGTYYAALESATKASEIVDFLNAFADDVITGPDDENIKTRIQITKGSAFLVLSTETKYYVVVISDNGVKTVDLNFFATPGKEE
jgi:hypothetical protein